jgi:hypothetical protein
MVKVIVEENSYQVKLKNCGLQLKDFLGEIFFLSQQEL